MKTKEQIEHMLRLLTARREELGPNATLEENAPRALLQADFDARAGVLKWVLKDD